jgi:hypothetical protein
MPSENHGTASLAPVRATKLYASTITNASILGGQKLERQQLGTPNKGLSLARVLLFAVARNGEEDRR